MIGLRLLVACPNQPYVERDCSGNLLSLHLRTSDVLLGELHHESLDEVGLGHVSKVSLLGGKRLAHGLRLLDGNLSGNGLGVHLGDGQRSGDLEVLRVEELLLGLLLEDGLDLHHRLNQLVVDSGLGLDSDNLGNLLLDLGSLVAAQEELALGLTDGLLGLGLLDKSLEVIDLRGLLLWLSSLERLALLGELLDDFLALFADGDAGIWVLHQGNELIALLEVGVVGLERNVEGDAHGEGDHETDKSGSALQVLVELLLRDVAVGKAGEEGGHAALNLLLALLLLEVARLLSEHGHGHVVGATHRLGRWDGDGRANFASSVSLSVVDEDVVSVVSRALNSWNLLAHAFFSGTDKDVVAVVALLLFNGSDSRHGLLGLVDEDVVSATLVVGGASVIVGCWVAFVASLELGALGLGGLGGDTLLDAVHGTHELEDGSGSDKSADSANLLNQTAHGACILVLGGIDTSLGLGDNQSPDGNGEVAERLLVGVRLEIVVGGAKSVALSAEAGLLHALGVHEVTESHEAECTDSEGHDESGETVEASLVVIDLALVLLDVLKELWGVHW